jgi:hypothetical protein
MGSREVFEKKTGSKLIMMSYEKYNSTDLKISTPDDYIKFLEEQNALMLEALKAIDEAINDNCISDAQMMIKNIINQVPGEQEG